MLATPNRVEPNMLTAFTTPTPRPMPIGAMIADIAMPITMVVQQTARSCMLAVINSAAVDTVAVTTNAINAMAKNARLPDGSAMLIGSFWLK
jgi:hypothetical protein